MVDALPYLVNYPYGCTEQTLSRFLPTAIVQKVLLEMKLDLKSIKEKRTNLNAQELGEAATRSKQWKRYQETPVFDEAEVNRMSRAGLERLTQMQLSDGGWGWFSGDRENASAHTTAYVVHGLQVARAAGLSVESSIISRGISWLEHHQAEEIQKLKNAPTSTHPYKSKADDLDAFVFMVLADEGKSESEMKEFIYRDRNGLSVYSKAAFGLALFKLEDREKLSMILRNIEQFVVTDEENQTSYLKLGNEGYWWYWYGSEYEAHAYYLKLLAKTNAQSSVASGLVKYLLNNRKNSTYWSSTRDTAVVLEAFADYLKATGENKPDLVVEVLVDGHPLKSVTINSENLFTFDGTVMLHGAEISSGKHTLTIKKSGKGALYYNAYVTNFTLEDNIKRAGLEVKVNRKFYKLVRENRDILASGAHGQALTQVSEKLVRVDLAEGETLKSGELVVVVL